MLEFIKPSKPMQNGFIETIQSQLTRSGAGHVRVSELERGQRANRELDQGLQPGATTLVSGRQDTPGISVNPNAGNLY